MTNNRVRHILVTKCDEDYFETLCGRIVRRLIVIRTASRRDHFGYVEFADNVDCQDCLRKHFKTQKHNARY